MVIIFLVSGCACCWVRIGLFGLRSYSVNRRSICRPHGKAAPWIWLHSSAELCKSFESFWRHNYSRRQSWCLEEHVLGLMSCCFLKNVLRHSSAFKYVSIVWKSLVSNFNLMIATCSASPWVWELCCGEYIFHLASHFWLLRSWRLLLQRPLCHSLILYSTLLVCLMTTLRDFLLLDFLVFLLFLMLSLSLVLRLWEVSLLTVQPTAAASSRTPSMESRPFTL